MRIIRIVYLSIFVLGALSAGALGQGFHERRGMMGPMHHSMEEWAGRLNLTEEQTARLQELRESYLRDTLAWRNEVAVKRFDLRDLLHNPQADPDQILAKQREISELQSKIQERGIHYHLGMRKILTPEQIKLLPRRFDSGGFPGHRMKPGRGRGMGRE